MPCNSDYMDADYREIELSRVCCLLDELSGKRKNKNHWNGYHPAVYNKAGVDGDGLVATLCAKLSTLDVSQYSLEMQMWWRDHQEADRQRLKREKEEIKRQKQREKALAKLSEEEKALLGIED